MATEAKLYRWDDIPRERLNPLMERQLITGDRVMLAHIHLGKGAVVPLHHHENEQVSCVMRGSIRFWLGADESREVVVRAGEVLHLPANLPHKAEALEDFFGLDVFSPPRQDWLDKTDDYLRGK